MTTRHQALMAVQTAIKHLGKGNMVSSARLSLSDAVIQLSIGEWQYAKERALTSLSYSVGVFHDDYRSLIKSNSTMMPAVRTPISSVKIPI